jgi:HicB_like antitoxin of bacterial toxin-antitoxin system
MPRPVPGSSRVNARVHSYINLTPDEDDGYTVAVPALPGCIFYGRTVAEAKKMAKEAIKYSPQYQFNYWRWKYAEEQDEKLCETYTP